MSDPIYRSTTPERSADGVEGEAVLGRTEARVRAVSSGFERWDDPHVHGPGLYFLF